MDEWLKLFQTNLHAPFILIKHLVSSLCQHRGHIINIGAAGLGRMRADTYSTAYTLTKQNLWMLTRSLALELAPAGVRVNMVSPGHLETSVNLPTDPLKLPMGRPGYHHEISRLILFLLDPANHYITGQNIEVAGGVSLQ
jgi:3-oxoacyl-[acyl-carrier protein] reductase